MTRDEAKEAIRAAAEENPRWRVREVHVKERSDPIERFEGIITGGLDGKRAETSTTAPDLPTLVEKMLRHVG